MQDFIMGNGFYNMVATVLLFMNLERTRSMQDSCSNCPADLLGGSCEGFRTVRAIWQDLSKCTFCGKNKNQICIPCPPNSFSSIGGQKACNICRRCEGVFRTKKACSPDSDAGCECVSGFHCLRAGCTMCEQDCKQGQELTEEGCKDCGFGTFNDQKHGICRPWTNCSSHGKPVLVNGTQKRDMVCGPALSDFTPGTPSNTVPAPVRRPDHNGSWLVTCLALTLAAVLFLVCFLVLCFSLAKRSREKLLYIFKQPFIKPVQTTQEEDACSCRFPEEEEGECEL